MNEIQLFGFEGKDVRIVVINGEPWFVAVDVCRVLEIKNSRRAIDSLDEEEKGVHSVNTPGGNQNMQVISEAGLYSLVSRSRKQEARTFWKWVRSVVLPSIRKTGKFESDSAIQAVENDARMFLMRELVKRDLEFKALQGEMINALKIALEAKDASQTAIRDARHAEEFCAWAPYASSKGIHRTTIQASQDGKRLSKMCEERGIERGRVTNERWEGCWTYPRALMDEYIEYYFRGSDGTEPIPMGG